MKRLHTLPSSFVAIALLLIAGPVLAGTLYVPGNHAQIHDAVQACAAGDTVMVAAGTYNDCTHPTGGTDSADACVIMKSGVTLIGAGSTTIIRATDIGRGIYAENVSNCRIENLQVTNAGSTHSEYCAGILLNNVPNSVELSDLLIAGNFDGAITCVQGASPTIRRVNMTQNVAKQGGGLAIETGSNPIVSDCEITYNTAPAAAGIIIKVGCDPVITNCLIANNETTASAGDGGGIFFKNGAGTVTNCVISNNKTLGSGGGLIFTTGSTATVTDCLIENNECAGIENYGGGIVVSESAVTLRNLIVVNNFSTGTWGDTGGIDIQYGLGGDEYTTVENCTFDGNYSVNGSAGNVNVQFASPRITRCIITNASSGAGMSCMGGGTVITSSNVWGNTDGNAICGTDGGGNISADPQFCGSSPEIWGIHINSLCNLGGGQYMGAKPVSCGTTDVPEGLAGVIHAGNSPNPFNPTTVIFFELPESGPAQLSIFDLAGRLIQQKTWDNLSSGRTEYLWNGTNSQGRAISSGVYLYQVTSQNNSTTKRMSLIR